MSRAKGWATFALRRAPGSTWPALTPDAAVVVMRDGVPVWQGRVA